MITEKKTLYVVTKSGEEYKQLRELVEANDDNGDEIVGVKDGTVRLFNLGETMWEKNALGENEKILFIGKVKKTSKLRKKAKYVDDNFGIRYGFCDTKYAFLEVNPLVLNDREKYLVFLKSLLDMPVSEGIVESKKSDKKRDGVEFSKKEKKIVKHTVAKKTIKRFIVPLGFIKDISDTQMEYNYIENQQYAYAINKRKEEIKETDKKIRNKAYEKSLPSFKEGIKITLFSAVFEGAAVFSIEVLKISKKKGGMENIEMQIKRMEESSALGLWDFSAYVYSTDPKLTQNVAYSYLSLIQGEKSFLGTDAVNYWDGSNKEDVEIILESLKRLRHPFFVLKDTIVLQDKNWLMYPPHVECTMPLSGKEFAYAMNFPRKSVSGLPVYEIGPLSRFSTN